MRYFRSLSTKNELQAFPSKPWHTNINLVETRRSRATVVDIGFEVTKASGAEAPMMHKLFEREQYRPCPASCVLPGTTATSVLDAKRVNSRIDNIFGFEKHYIRGQQKMKLRVSLAFCVMLAMALGRIKEKQKELMRSIFFFDFSSKPHGANPSSYLHIDDGSWYSDIRNSCGNVSGYPDIPRGGTRRGMLSY